MDRLRASATISITISPFRSSSHSFCNHRRRRLFNSRCSYFQDLRFLSQAPQDFHRKTTHALVHLHPISASSASPPLPPSSGSNGDRRLVLVACSTVTVVLAIANRVLHKLALVPMKEFPFFLAQLTTFGYQAGVVADEMLAFPITFYNHWFPRSSWSCFWKVFWSQSSRTSYTHIESGFIKIRLAPLKAASAAFWTSYIETFLSCMGGGP